MPGKENKAKVGIVYTAVAPESAEAINAEIQRRLGEKIEILNYFKDNEKVTSNFWAGSVGANPYIQITTSSPKYEWIRLSGKAVFVNDRAIKEAALENPIVKGNYQTADNPAFEVFYLEDPHGVIADFSGNPPYEF